MCHFYRIIYNSGINKSILLSENSSLNFLRLLPDVLASDLTSIENRSSAIEKIQSHCSYFFSPPTLRKLLKSFTTSRTHQTSVSNAPASYRLIRIIPTAMQTDQALRNRRSASAVRFDARQERPHIKRSCRPPSCNLR